MKPKFDSRTQQDIAAARLNQAAKELYWACKAAAKLWEDDPRLANGGIADRLNAAIKFAETGEY